MLLSQIISFYTYDEYSLAHDEVPENFKFCGEEDQFMLLMHNGQVSGIELPAFIELEVIQTERGFTGSGPANAMKRAIVEHGIEVFVPMFINERDCIRIDLRTGEYTTRTE